MAKQLVVSVLEDVVGEYFLNISKENLKIAALRGKIKLENVQLDGDLIGSHVLGVAGLSGFGVLSCWARSVRMVVSWKSLEKEPTRFEISGVHLICVPLLPSTSARMHGAGTTVDPRCTLRTRAKRSTLARFERNFFSGRLPGEGPPPRRLRRAKVKQEESHIGFDDEENDYQNRDDSQSDRETRGRQIGSSRALEGSTKSIPVPQWRAKLRAKVLRNIEISIKDIHLRCEVPKGGLDLCAGSFSVQNNTIGVRGECAEHQSFCAFGVTLESFVIKTANQNWEAGKAHVVSPKDESSTSSAHRAKRRTCSRSDLRAPAIPDGHKYVLIELNNFSIYWDDEPALLVSESELLKSQNHALSSVKLQARLAVAMEVMKAYQDPGDVIKKSLSPMASSSPHRRNATAESRDPCKPHGFIISAFSTQVRTTLDLTGPPGQLSCLAEFLPFDLVLYCRSYQYQQYQKLRSAMLSQQRFDSMLCQRPGSKPCDNPKAWWKYAIACVTTRPTSRPWDDVTRISRSRVRYIELVEKKLLRSDEGNGFHGGLSEPESVELLALENLLPIEVLVSFHLLALRNVYEMQKFSESSESNEKKRRERSSDSPCKGRHRPQSRSSLKMLRKALVGGSRDESSEVHLSARSPDEVSSSDREMNPSSDAHMSQNPLPITVRMYDSSVTVNLLHAENGKPIVRVEMRATGVARSFEAGRRDLVFDVTKFEVMDCLHPVPISDNGKIVLVEASPSWVTGRSSSPTRPDVSVELANRDARMMLRDEPELKSDEAVLPPPGVLFRLSASRDRSRLALSVTAHPASLVWSKPCIDAVTDFFISPNCGEQSGWTMQLRNAATPLARKAQLALLSPTGLSVNLNISAPKLWIPVSSEISDGAVFLDAGRLKMIISKKEMATDTNWQIAINDIQVDFVRRRFEQHKDTGESYVSGVQPRRETTSNEEIQIVRPFHIKVVAYSDEAEKKQNRSHQFSQQMDAGAIGPVRTVVAFVSPVCLNLVDAEVLARAIGKWYAQGIVRVRRREAVIAAEMRSSVPLPRGRSNALIEGRPDRPSGRSLKLGQLPSMSRAVTLSIERIEMALQGHSEKPTEKKRTDTSRTYHVDVLSINVRRTNHLRKTLTRVSISDASVVLLEKQFSSIPAEVPCNPSQAHYYVLIRECEAGTHAVESARLPKLSHSRPPPTESSGTDVLSDGDNRISTEFGILKASHLHDGDLQLDEVEIDMESVVARVTPTSLEDTAKGLRRIIELVQVMTREMERKVHEQGRKARQERGCQGKTSVSKPVAETNGKASMEGLNGSPDDTEGFSDSSILFKVEVKESTLLAGRPVVPAGNLTPKERMTEELAEKCDMSNTVMQILLNTLIMVQSIENPDASGSKTLHISIDDASVSINSDFERIPLSEAHSMIGPTSIEFRVVYATENLGCVVSQDISFDCDMVKAHLTLGNVTDLANVSREMYECLRPVRRRAPCETESHSAMPPQSYAPSIIRYQKKGTGIATYIRAEVQTLSFVLLRAHRVRNSSIPLFDVSAEEVKGLLEGCMSALSGECRGILSLNFFQSDVALWEHSIEPFDAVLDVEQMPNEVILQIKSGDAIQMNLTGALLKDLAGMNFDLRNSNKEEGAGKHQTVKETGFVSPSVTVGGDRIKKAYMTSSATLDNQTGLLLYLRPAKSGNEHFESDCIFVSAGSRVVLDSFFSDEYFAESLSPSLELGFVPSKTVSMGGEESLLSVPVFSSSGYSAAVHKMKPLFTDDLCSRTSCALAGKMHASSECCGCGRFCNAEPVVEWCVQNQRLRPNIPDVFSLEKDRDLLSSSVWSPEASLTLQSERVRNHESTGDRQGFDVRLPSGGKADGKKRLASDQWSSNRSNWLRPYLKNDSPEWTDMTSILGMARERVMLPDDAWIWLNDWTVELSGSLGESTDADGWEYEADFETFGRNRRYYRRGDLCRRRRWTRTRMMKPPKIIDPHRPLWVMWETSRPDNGNVAITVRSHVVIQNCTSTTMSFFVSSTSWDDDVMVGTAESGGRLPVPAPLATAMYMRIAINHHVHTSGDNQGMESKNDTIFSRRVMILPTSFTSSVFLRTTTIREDNDFKPKELDSISRNYHFLIQVECSQGATEIRVHPVLRISNLLPCEVMCHFGEICSDEDATNQEERIIGTATLRIASGKEGKCTAVDPALKPHMSLRVPGYERSPWQRIINRKANSGTWRPNEEEEESLIRASKGDVDYAEEYKSLVRFERIGGKSFDPLVVIMSVEIGHCPTIRIYAQYMILDKTGFGCRFSEGFSDLLGTTPDAETSRHSHLLQEESRNVDFQREMALAGHEWSVGMSGMTLFFSSKEKLTFSVETGASGNEPKLVRSKWVSPMDISNVMPKTVVSVDEDCGLRIFELGLSVTVCPSVFSRTKLVTLFPRYQIVNLLHEDLVVAQDGCCDSGTCIPSQASVPFHWVKRSSPLKVRLGQKTRDVACSEKSRYYWTNGCIQLDKVGITSMRLPTQEIRNRRPVVVQVEVRLASKYQSSAVVVVIWSTDQYSNPLYLLRNRASRTILCRQPLQDEGGERVETGLIPYDERSGTGEGGNKASSFECGTDFGPIVNSIWGLDRKDEFVWILESGEEACFGFDDPEEPHILEWTYVSRNERLFSERSQKAVLEVDAMGSCSTLSFLGGGEVRCQICAEHSTKVIDFVERFGDSTGQERSLDVRSKFPGLGRVNWDMGFDSGVDHPQNETQRSREDEEDLAFSLRIELVEVSISVVDNATREIYGREILHALLEGVTTEFSQSREGYHELEFKTLSLQVDNHVHKSIHPVLVFCPSLREAEPFFHFSAVRKLQPHSSTFVFKYAALRVLEIEIYLDRRTAETVARFIQPLRKGKDVNGGDPHGWIVAVTSSMCRKFPVPDYQVPREVENIAQTANSGRIYFEQLLLHPVRLGLTFTQEWLEWNSGSEGMMIFQFIRGMASIANAPITFTSFVVGNAFESPQSLLRIISTHYSSQLTKQIFGILGSLAVLGAPADFISNVGTGVRDFFYEPINGMVHGPAQFIEGLEAGTQSLARGVFVGVVRGAANVTEVLNSNLAGLTADDDFIDERKAHQRMLTDAMSRGGTDRTISDSLYLAGASVARGVKSGATGILEQPAVYASRHGPLGFVKGVGKAFVGAIVKPVVGVGDAAVLVMNHVSEVTSNKQVLLKIPKRLRRALPRLSVDRPFGVQLVPYDERAAKAQKIVTGGESVNDVYIGHVNMFSHLFIASDQCLWAIDRRSRDPWCASWEEVSHFGMVDGGAMRITVFSQTGLKSHLFQVQNDAEFAELYYLLAMQIGKMGNCSGDLAELDSSLFNGGLENISKYRIPGIKAPQANHVFGTSNNKRRRLSSTVEDEIDVIEHSFARVRFLGSESPTFFKTLDEEAWTLVDSWGQVFSGLRSRRCVAASIINGTGCDIQIKTAKLMEGGSPCYSIPSKEFDQEQGVLHPGGAIIFFCWGLVPNLLQGGNVCMNIETNAFVCDLSDHKSRSTFAMSLPGYQVGFLEKSYDENGWWAKYWLLVRKE